MRHPFAYDFDRLLMLLMEMCRTLSVFRISAPSSLLGYPRIASSSDSFSISSAMSAHRSSPRIPRKGLAVFTIVDSMMRDSTLVHFLDSRAESLARDKLSLVVRERGEKVRAWCDMWKFEGDAEENEGEREGSETIRVPGWEEIVQKTEELVWLATVLLGTTTRPGYKEVKLDFFLSVVASLSSLFCADEMGDSMHALTSVLFLPCLLEKISPKYRAALLISHFRTMIAYWVSRGRYVSSLYLRWHDTDR